MSRTLTPRKLRITATPGVAVGWVIIGALVLVYPDDLESLGMSLTVIATAITVLIVHFLAELFLGHNAVSSTAMTFPEVLKKESVSMGWMSLWLLPALIPAVLYGADVIAHLTALEMTSRVIQIMAGLLGFFVGWAKGRSWWASALMGVAFALVISLALLIEAITHTFTSALH
ncbi:MAG: hypothetical protein ACEQR4_06655 [Rhodoluna sp.]